MGEVSYIVTCLWSFWLACVYYGEQTDELAQSSKDLINLAFGAFLPIIGMLGKHWFEVSHDEPAHNPEPDKPKEEDDSSVTP